MDYISELKRVFPLIKKNEYIFELEEGNYASYEKGIAMEDWGMNYREFEEFAEWMWENGMTYHHSAEYEKEDGYGRIVDIYPEMHGIKDKVVERFLKNNSRRASVEDRLNFEEFIFDATYDIETPILTAKNVSYSKSVKLGKEAIRRYNQVKRAEVKVANLFGFYEDTQSLQEDYYSKNQMGRWSKAEQRLNKLDKLINIAEDKFAKLLSKYGLSGGDLPESLEDFVGEMFLYHNLKNWEFELGWDMRGGEWDIDVDPSDLFDPTEY